jgi:hypothetical protein
MAHHSSAMLLSSTLHAMLLSSSTLQGYFYYIFGFAFLVAVLTIIITIEVSIVCTYVQVGRRAG